MSRAALRPATAAVLRFTRTGPLAGSNSARATPHNLTAASNMQVATILQTVPSTVTVVVGSSIFTPR